MNEVFSAKLSLMLLHSIWQGVIVVVVAALLFRLLAKSSANSRYLVACGAMLCLPVLALLTFCFVEVPVEMLAVQTAMDVAPQEPDLEVASLDVELNAALPSTTAEEVSGFSSNESTNDLPLVDSDGALDDGISNSTAEVATVSERLASWLKPWMPWLSSMYLFGVAVMLFRLLLGIYAGLRLRGRSTLATDQNLTAMVADASRKLGMKFAPAVYYCEHIAVPAVIGVLKPAILLPASFVTGLSANEVSAILAHELAHVRRFDLAVQLIQKLVESLMFFHPAVWWLSRQIDNERENCCDDLAAKIGSGNLGYAAALLKVAERCLSSTESKVALLSAEGTNPRQLSRRIERQLKLSGKSLAPARQIPIGAFLLATLTLATLIGLAFAVGPDESSNNEMAEIESEVVLDDQEIGAKLSPEEVDQYIQAQTERIKRALESTVDLNVEDGKTLQHAIGQLVRQQQIPILLKEDTFSKQGIPIHSIPAVELKGRSLKRALESLLKHVSKNRTVTPQVMIEDGVLALALEVPWQTLKRPSGKPPSVIFKSLDDNEQPIPRTLVEARGSEGTYFYLSDAKGICRAIGHGITPNYVMGRTENDQRMAYRPHTLSGSLPQNPIPLNFVSPREVSVRVQDSGGLPVRGATVCIKSDSHLYGRTNKDGVAKILLHEGIHHAPTVFALKPKVGFGFVEYSAWFRDGDKELPEVQLSLSKANQVKVIATDENGEPVDGVSVIPHWFSRLADEQLGPREIDKSQELGFWKSAAPVAWSLTNQKGEVEFDCLPVDLKVSFTTLGTRLGHNNVTMSQPGQSTVEFKMTQAVEVSGRIVDSDGNPVEDASVIVRGDNGSYGTDSDGRYSFLHQPDSNPFYLEASSGDKRQRQGQSPWAHTIAGQPLQLDDVVLKPAARVSGQLKWFNDSKPASNANLSYSYSVPELPPALAEKFPPLGYGYGTAFSTDQDGRFEFFVSPNEYTIRCVSYFDQLKEFTVTGSEEHKFDLVIPRTLKFEGRVVTGDPARSVPDATIKMKPLTHQTWAHDTTTDADGKFSRYRDGFPALVFISNEDKSLMGVRSLTPEDVDIDFKISPPVVVKARLVDSDGRPQPRRKVKYGIEVRIRTESHPKWDHELHVCEGVTDGDGLMTMQLVEGAEHTVRVDGEIRKVKVDRSSEGKTIDFVIPSNGADDPDIAGFRKVNISGKTLDANGQPVEGATVYLVSTYTLRAKDEYKVVATAVSNEEGVYEFADVDLPSGSAADEDVSDEVGRFEILATAKGHGMAWLPEQEVDHYDMDLQFSKPATMQGRVVDETGKPMAGVKIRLTHCTRLRQAQPVMGTDELTSVFQDAAPKSLTRRTTDSDGRFQFTDLPHAAQLRFIARTEGYARESKSAAALDNPDLYVTKPLIHDGIIDFTMRPIRKVPIRVVYADSKQPADRVMLSAGGNGTSNSVTTDSDGNGELKLPVGEYDNIILYPRIGTRYRRTKESRSLKVTANDDSIPTFEIQPASELNVTVVDAETGKPIPNVRLEVDGSAHGWRCWEFETNISHFVDAFSDESGKVSTLVVPGLRRIGVRAYDLEDKYQISEASIEVECAASEAQTIMIKVEPILNEEEISIKTEASGNATEAKVDRIVTVCLFPFPKGRLNPGPLWVIAETEVSSLADIEELGADACESNTTIETHPPTEKRLALEKARIIAKERQLSLYELTIGEDGVGDSLECIEAFVDLQAGGGKPEDG